MYYTAIVGIVTTVIKKIRKTFLKLHRWHFDVENTSTFLDMLEVLNSFIKTRFVFFRGENKRILLFYVIGICIFIWLLLHDVVLYANGP